MLSGSPKGADEVRRASSYGFGGKTHTSCKQKVFSLSLSPSQSAQNRDRRRGNVDGENKNRGQVQRGEVWDLSLYTEELT